MVLRPPLAQSAHPSGAEVTAWTEYAIAKRQEAARLVDQAADVLELVPPAVDGDVGSESRWLRVVAGRVRAGGSR
jgi:hypothetical protein